MKLSDNITAYLADCMDHMRDLPDDFYDWGISDPNYGIGASRPSKKPGAVVQKNGTILQAPTNDYEHQDWDDQPAHREYFEEFTRVTKKQIIWGANYYDFPLPGGRLVWDKLNGDSDQYDCEIAYLSFTKRTEMVYYKWRGMIQGRVVSSNPLEAWHQQGNKQLNEKRVHPTQKPVLLCKWILDRYVEPGSTIYDSHSGSNSLAIAAELHGCPIDTTEINEKNYLEGANRVQKFLAKRNIFSIT